MTVLGLAPSGRSGLSPSLRQLSAPRFSPDQVANLAFWYRAGDPQNTMTDGAVRQALDHAGPNTMQLFKPSLEPGLQQIALTRADGGITQIAIWTADVGTATLRDPAGPVNHGDCGSFGTPAALVLDARRHAGPFNHAEIDEMGTFGVTTALAASDQLKLIDQASANRGV
jgi:hypothetical protein